jgi:arylsulfatase A-like enzyme
MMTAVTYLRGILVAMMAGGLGGALIGLAEAALISATSAAADEYWLFHFGALAYGAIGAGLGLAAALAWQIVRRGRAADAQLAAVAAAAGVLLPAFAVARYHVAQRVFQEGLVTTSATGLLTHAGLLVGALLAAALAALLARLCLRAAGGVALAGALALILGGAWLGGMLTDRTAKPAVARHGGGGAAGKPNIILIVVDTLRADAAHWAAQQSDGPQGFAQLARQSVRFERAYAQSSWTRPSIATILTAQYPSVHGVEHKMDFLSDKADTLAEVLQRQGYWTAAFTTNINVAPIFNFQQGFDEYSYLEPSFYFGATDSATKLAVYKGLRVGREKVSSSMWVENYYQDADVVDAEVEQWLASKPPEPYFLFIHYMDPHDPYFEIPYNGRGVARVSTPNPPAERVEELHRLYRDDVRYFDGYLERLLERLRAGGAYDRSIVALTADHGEEFHEHGGWWHGTSLYEEQVHVPLFIKRAAEPAAGTVRNDIARTLDIAPTLAAAAGLPVPESFQGVDLFTDTVDEPLLAEEDLEGNRLSSIHSGDWKLIIANPDNPRGLAPTELYNLSQDPGERTNLAAQEGGRVSEMLAQLEQFKARIAARAGRAIGARSHAADPRS